MSRGPWRTSGAAGVPRPREIECGQPPFVNERDSPHIGRGRSRSMAERWRKAK